MLLHALLLVCLIAGGASAQCDDNTYINCQAALNSALNLTDPRPYANPTAFRYQVELFYQKSPSQGIRTVCKAFRQFKQCMGANYATCMTPSNFVTSGNTVMNSYIFISTFNTMHYTCGGGFQVYLSNSACMAKAWTNEDISNQLYACRTQYEAKAGANPDQACLLLNTFMTCWEQQFLGACGSDAKDTQFWGCEYARIDGFTRYPACPQTCVLPQYGGIIG